MLTKGEISCRMNGFNCPKYLTESCWQPIYDQCVAAIDLAAENERLKAKLDTLTAISEQDDRCYVQLKAKLDAVRKWTSNPVRIDDFGYQMAQESVLSIIDKDGDET